MSCITYRGFVRPPRDEIVERKKKRAKSLFGENIDVSSESTLGKFILLEADDDNELYESIEDVFFSAHPHHASGQALDNAAAYAGIRRNPATAAKMKVRFTGIPGKTIDSGFLVSGNDIQKIYYTVRDLVIGEKGTVDGQVNCTEEGTSGNVLPSEINTIVNPSEYVSKVQGIEIISLGEEREKDVHLRDRFDSIIIGLGCSINDAIRSAVLRVD